MQLSGNAFANIALLLMHLSTIECGKLLLFPAPTDSHYLYFTTAAMGLTKKGHDVYILTTPDHHWAEKLKVDGYQVLTYRVKLPEPGTNADKKKHDSFNMMSRMKQTSFSGIELMRNLVDAIWPVCVNALEDESLFMKLKSMKFTLFMMDGIPATRCYYALPYRLGVPFVTLATYHEPWLAKSPALPSFVPFGVGGHYSHKMNLWAKTTNFWSQISWYYKPRFNVCEDEIITKFVPEKEAISINYLIGTSLLWFYNIDLLYDSPFPLMPNMIPVGGLTTKPAQALAPDVEHFMQNSRHGVIVVSFGSIVKSLPEEYEYMLMEAFSKLPEGYVIIWRTVSNISSVEHILTLPWLPQNDLLGHSKTVLFITHCGSNGQFEALYHGVPMVGLPMFSDQPSNAQRMVNKGYGLKLSWQSITSEKLLNAIQTILNNDMFKLNIKKASKIYRSRKTHPRDRIVYWIDHILKHGADHLHSSALEMSSYAYLMLDIIALMFVTLLIFCVICTSVCTFWSGHRPH